MEETSAIPLLPSQEDAEHTELLITIAELNVSMGVNTYDVFKGLNILKKEPTVPLGTGPSEVELIEKFQQKFDEIKESTDARKRNIKCDYFMQTHKHLQTLEPDERKRIQFLHHLYTLFDAKDAEPKSPRTIFRESQELFRNPNILLAALDENEQNDGE